MDGPLYCAAASGIYLAVFGLGGLEKVKKWCAPKAAIQSTSLLGRGGRSSRASYFVVSIGIRLHQLFPLVASSNTTEQEMGEGMKEALYPVTL